MSVPIEIFPPGDFLREEIEARGWTQNDLAEIMGRPVETINRLIAGKLAITPETARGLASAFGTSAELWLNLETAYQLAQVNSDADVAKRARLYSLAPVKDIVKRGWIESSSNVDVLEKQILRHYELSNIDETPSFNVAARKSTPYGETNAAQLAWFYCAKHVAAAQQVSGFTKSKLAKALDKLRALATHPNETRNVPAVLNEAGIRFVVIEQLPKSKIDGAAFWLDKTPVIALSIRYDRIDWFWHTLTHEVGHIAKGHALSVDTNLVGNEAAGAEDKPEEERQADEFACNFLVPKEELDDFINRIRPLYRKDRIVGFANRLNVHPGIVVGQLQHRGEISYSHSREMLAKVRAIVTSTADTDGWGHGPAL